MVPPPPLPPGLDVSLSKVKNDAESHQDEVLETEERGSDNKLAKQKKNKKKNDKKKEKLKAKKAKQHVDEKIIESGSQPATSSVEMASIVNQQGAKHTVHTTETTDTSSPFDSQQPYSIVTFGTISALRYRASTQQVVYKADQDRAEGNENTAVNTNAHSQTLQDKDDDDNEGSNENDRDENGLLRRSTQMSLMSEAVVGSSSIKLDTRGHLDTSDGELKNTPGKFNLSRRHRSHTTSVTHTIQDDAATIVGLSALFRQYRGSFSSHESSRDYRRGWDCLWSTRTEEKEDDVVVEDDDMIDPLGDGEISNADFGRRDPNLEPTSVEDIVKKKSEERDVEVPALVREGDVDFDEVEQHYRIQSGDLLGLFVKQIDLVFEPHHDLRMEMKELWKRGHRYVRFETKLGFKYAELLNEECYHRFLSDNEHDHLMRQDLLRKSVMSGLSIVEMKKLTHELHNPSTLDLSIEEEEVMKSVFEMQIEKARAGIPTMIRDRRVFCRNHGSKSFPFAQIVDTQGNLNPITESEAIFRRLLPCTGEVLSIEQETSPISSDRVDTGIREGSLVDIQPIDNADERSVHECRVLLNCQGDAQVGGKNENEANMRQEAPRRKRQSGSHSARLAARKRGDAGKLQRPPRMIAQDTNKCTTLPFTSADVPKRSNSIASSTDSGLFLNDE